MDLRTVVAVVVFCCGISAQTGQFFRAEYPVDPLVLSEGNTPSWLIDAVTIGQLEIRQQVLLDAPSKQVWVRTFTVAPGSPEITPLVVAQEALLERYRVTIDVSDLKPQVFSVTGTIAEIYRMHITGAEPGGSFSLTADFDGTGSALRSTEVVLPGVARVYASRPAGNFAAHGNGDFPPVANGGPDMETAEWEVKLDATKSYDPEGTELDYKWRVTIGNAALRGCETATPILQLVGGPGLYEVEVLVTDAGGAASSDTVRILYSGR